MYFTLPERKVFENSLLYLASSMLLGPVCGVVFWDNPRATLHQEVSPVHKYLFIGFSYLTDGIVWMVCQCECRSLGSLQSFHAVALLQLRKGLTVLTPNPDNFECESEETLA
eukprot:s1169_g12.t1